MGHNIKTASRSDAINRNAERIKMLAEKIGEMGGLVANVHEELIKQAEVITERVYELENGFAEQIRGINDRLDAIEQPIWRKIMKKVKKKKEVPASPNHRAVMLDVQSVRHQSMASVKPKAKDPKK